MLINYVLITARTRISVFAPSELAVQIMKVSGSEQKQKALWGLGERGRGKGPGGYNSVTMWLLHRLSDTDSLNPLIMYQKKGEKGVEMGFTHRG